MAVNIFVVIALGQTAELPTKTFAAGVVATRGAKAIAPPIAKGFNDRLELTAVGIHSAAFTHGDVVGGVKTQGRDIAEGADKARRSRRNAFVVFSL